MILIRSLGKEGRKLENSISDMVGMDFMLCTMLALAGMWLLCFHLRFESRTQENEDSELLTA